MTQQLTTTREERGKEIAKYSDQIRRIDDNTYTVKSQSHDGEYTIAKVCGEWLCECADNKYRRLKCKHIYAVEFSISLRAEVKVRHIEPFQNLSECIRCGSRDLIKKGIRKNKTGNIQKFYCRNCQKYFTINVGFERMKHNPKAITSAMQLYFSGESLRNTMKSLKLLGVEVSYRTILNWIRKYTTLMTDYVETLKPNVGNTWRADEVWVKIKGDQKYLFALMDDETRYWIAQEVADTKHTHDARNLFRMGKELMGKKPKTLITDALPSYHDAYLKEYWTNTKPRTEHINSIKFSSTKNNNKMERMNGEIRDREKTMRGLKTKDTAILKGYQLYHNYFRPHEGLEGKTPAEASKIIVEGENKWITLIQNATKTNYIKL